MFDERQLSIDMESDEALTPEFVEAEGEKYYLPKTIDNHSYGQWVDCNGMMAKFAGAEYEFYPLNMALWLTKEGEEYGYGIDEEAKDYGAQVSAELDKRHAIFQGVSVEVALRVNAFFLQSSEEYKTLHSQFFPLAESLIKPTPLLSHENSPTSMGALANYTEPLK